jgi:peptidyl-tRNA hydrolase
MTKIVVNIDLDPATAKYLIQVALEKHGMSFLGEASRSREDKSLQEFIEQWKKNGGALLNAEVNYET